MGLKNNIALVISFCMLLWACNHLDSERKKYYTDYDPALYKDFKLTDIQMNDMSNVINYLDNIKFNGEFGYDDSTHQITYGFCESPANINYDSIQVLNKYNIKAGVMHESDFTYFKINGGFIDDNYGLLYQKADSIKIPGVINKRKLRDNINGGTWYFAETKL